MPPSLADARRETAQRLRQQVDRATRDEQLATGRADPLLDRKRLRGWPAVGRGIDGAMAGSAPGSDEHLDRLGR